MIGFVKIVKSESPSSKLCLTITKAVVTNLSKSATRTSSYKTFSQNRY